MDKLFLYLISPLNEDIQLVSWYLWLHKPVSGKVDPAAPGSISGTGTLDEFASIYLKDYIDTEVVAVISGEYLTYTDVAITVKNHKQMLQALPFLVEEQIVGNIEDMHIAVPDKMNTDSIRIAVIEKIVLDKIKAVLLTKNISVNFIFGLPDLLVYESGELQILLHDEFAIVKAQNCCFQCDQINLEAILELVNMDDLSTITISLHELNKYSLSLAKKIKNKFGSDLLKIQSSIFTEDILSYIIKSCAANTEGSLNILQGDLFSSGSNKQIYQFLPVAWVAILCLFLQISFNIASGLYFKQLSGKTYKNAANQYLQLFPEDKKVINLASQLTAKMNAPGSDAHSSRFPVIFSSTLNAISEVAGQSDIKLKQFRYDESSGELKIGLDTSSITLLDKLKNKLSEANFTVEINSANEENGLIKATLSIKNV